MPKRPASKFVIIKSDNLSKPYINNLSSFQPLYEFGVRGRRICYYLSMKRLLLEILSSRVQGSHMDSNSFFHCTVPQFNKKFKFLWQHFLSEGWCVNYGQIYQRGIISDRIISDITFALRALVRENNVCKYVIKFVKNEDH